MATYENEGGRGPEPKLFEGLPRWAVLLMQASIGIAGLLFLYLLLDFVKSAYTDWLWFSNVGLREVFSTGLFTRVVLYIIAFAGSTAAVYFSYRWAWRASWGPTALPFSPFATAWIRRSIVIGAAVMGVIVVFSFAGGLSERWVQFLRFWNSTSFGIADPQFGLDVGFYVFTLPMLHTLQGWLLGLSVVTLITTTGLYLLIYSARGINPIVTPRAKQQLAVTGAVMMVAIGAGHFLDTYETLFSQTGAVTGATYADVNARIPALYLLTAVALLAAGIMLASLRVNSLRESMRMIIAAFVLWAVAGLLAGFAWPFLVQRLSVEPSEFQRELPYIERNIEWTRRGFDLERVQEVPYNVRSDTLARDISNNPETMSNIRLWGPGPLNRALNQIQHLRLYYNFLDVDVDRYTVDGEYRQVLVGTREIYQNGLDQTAQNWINRKLVYTHGYGVVMATATEVTASGQPNLIVSDVPLTGVFEIQEPRVYYGEAFGADSGLVNDEPATGEIVSDDVVVVNTRERQFDRPANTPNELPIFLERYEGTGGVPVGSFFRRLFYAWEFGDMNFIFSGEFTDDSRVMYRRNVSERVRAVAPWLELDDDPYMVVSEDGKLHWIQDAYITTDRFPYSRIIQQVASSGEDAASRTAFDSPLNYIRNNVKVVINAYDGSMTFYTIEVDEPDPILDMWRNTFPGLFTPIEEMPPSLRAHIRYPEELLEAQADTFLQYHMTDAREFFLKEDQWQLGQEIVGASQSTATADAGGQGASNQRLVDNTRVVDPYYVIMKLPGQEQEEFVLVLPFTPQEKPNLVAWMAARSDGEHYGEIIVYEFPKDRIFNGPAQIEARIDNDPQISEQFTLWDQSGSRVIRGNLFVIPIGESLIYAEPIYLQSESLALPELTRVILATDTDVVMSPTMDGAIRALLLGERPDRPGGPVDGGVDPNQLLLVVEELRDALESLLGGASALDDTLRQLEELAEEAL